MPSGDRARIAASGVVPGTIAVHVELAEPPRDELCVLRPEVEDEECLVSHVLPPGTEVAARAYGQAGDVGEVPVL